MASAPVVLLGQGEQYEDPDDWRELIRARRIRRGVELAVRRDGLTTLRRPEDVPELAAVLDVVDPPGPPVPTAATPAAPLPGAPTSAVPPTPAYGVAGPPPAEPEAGAGPPPPGRRLPTAEPRRGWRFGLWMCLLGFGALLWLRLCAHDGFGPAPAFGARGGGGSGQVLGAAAEPARCGRPHGWIEAAACRNPGFARLRPALARAYAARAAGLDGPERDALAAEQARWSASRGGCRRAAEPAACLAPRYRARIAALKARRPAGDAGAAAGPAGEAVRDGADADGARAEAQASPDAP